MCKTHNLKTYENQRRLALAHQIVEKKDVIIYSVGQNYNYTFDFEYVPFAANIKEIIKYEEQ